jgi:hypothetical protein
MTRPFPLNAEAFVSKKNLKFFFSSNILEAFKSFGMYIPEELY